MRGPTAAIQWYLYRILRRSPLLSAPLRAYAARHFSALPGHVRLRELYRHRLLKRPQYYLGLVRALDLADRLRLARFSILELGVAEGRGILLLQSLVRAMQSSPACMGKEVRILGFDTFTGLPEVTSTKDGGAWWRTGDYPGDVDRLTELVDRDLVHLISGLFSESIPPQRQFLREYPPLLVIVDCDLYSSTVAILDGLRDVLPPASYWYFDDTAVSFFDPRVGERAAIEEFNAANQRFRFVPDYKALEEPVLAHMALTKLFYLVADDYAEQRRSERVGVERLPISPRDARLFGSTASVAR